MRTACTIFVLGFVFMVSVFVSSIYFWMGPALFLAMAFFFVTNALRKIPADPPHKGVLTFFGERQDVVLNEGWNFLPLYPFVFGFVLVKVVKVTSTFGPQRVRTPDGAVISTSEALIWLPGIEGEPESYINYLNSGGEAGVEAILRERVEDRVKTWAASNQEGPATWREAMGLRDEAHGVLAKVLLGDVLVSIPKAFQGIPTGTWMRFLHKPKSPPAVCDMRPENGENGIPWASPTKDAEGNVVGWNWDGLQAIFISYTSDMKVELEASVDKRRAEVNSLRSAKGNFKDKSLGITILGFSVDEIQVEGKVAEAAEDAERERREKDADKEEIQNVSDRVKKLCEDHPGLSVDKAIELVQTERKKVGKTIIAVSGAQTAVGNDLLGLAGIAKQVVEAIRGGGQGGQGNPQGGGNPVPTADDAKNFFDVYEKYPKWDPLKRTPN